MKIAIWGSELTAWVTAAALAQTGNDICFVSNSQIMDPITLMGSSIRNEPGLRDLIVDGFENKRIRLAQTRTALGIQAHVLSMKPSEYFRRNVRIGSSCMSRREADLRHEIGIGNIMWGTDYPHPEGLATPTDFANDLQEFSEKEIQSVMRENLVPLLERNPHH